MSNKKSPNPQQKRFEELYNGLQEKNARQKKSIDRLLAMTLTAVGVLSQMVEPGSSRTMGVSKDVRKLAQKALDDIERMRASDQEDGSGNAENQAG